MALREAWMRSPLMRRLSVAVAALVVIAGGSTVLAAPASADQVWHQSVGRASAEAVCPASDSADVAAGWSEWTASWEQWPNDGAGGYVCSRVITWAKDTRPPGIGSECVLVTPSAVSGNGEDNYWLYTGEDPLPPTATGYVDATCTIGSGDPANAWSFLYSDSGTAAALCQSLASLDGRQWTYQPRLWVCY